MPFSTADARQELLDSLGEAVSELAVASVCLTEAYERLDDQAGDRLEETCFRPVQTAYGRAMRTRGEFARRHGLAPAPPEGRSTGLPSQRPPALVERAVEAAGMADRSLAELQDSMLPVEAGDEELRAGLREIREPLAGLPASATELLRTLGR